jgi:3-methylfumaryl-CoA hydratase
MVENSIKIDIDHLRSWVGRKQEFEDRIARNPAAALAATLDHESVPTSGDVLGPLWHWTYFTPLNRQSELGVDGHPRLGGFMPPVPLPRRMWAGGRLNFNAPIRIGDHVSKCTEIADIIHKTGRQGDLVFLTLRHTYTTSNGIALQEEQDLVYKGPSPASSSVAPAPASGAGTVVERVQWRDPIDPTSTLLMRYSALTFNAHRIHYDLPYAQEQEGYPALVVHGPLIATLLADRLVAHVPGRLISFDFRGLKALFEGQTFHLCGRKEDDGSYTLWAEALDGSPAMTARALIERG